MLIRRGQAPACLVPRGVRQGGNPHTHSPFTQNAVTRSALVTMAAEMPLAGTQSSRLVSPGQVQNEWRGPGLWDTCTLPPTKHTQPGTQTAQSTGGHSGQEQWGKLMGRSWG